MCGIAGLIATNRPFRTEDLVAMAEAVRHRGPDDEGYVFVTQSGHYHAFGGKDTPPSVRESHLPYSPHDRPPAQAFSVGLAHRRLAIVDLSATGHQPMCTPDRRFWIVYNGEVYNHVELRSELESLGLQFISRSDTEVILQAYRHWGPSCLDRFNGMFAFLIVDTQERKLFAARDRFGVKPLYIWRSPSGLVAFASEIKQFTVLPNWQARMNGQRAYDFLNWGLSDHTRETIFADVVQLRGGECFEATFEELSAIEDPIRHIYAWYRLSPASFSGSFEDAVQHTRELLRDSVCLRLRADVDIGSCLSGGLDSSSIVCLMRQVLRSQGVPSRQMTFSAVSTEGRLDERKYIRSVVECAEVDAYDIEPKMEELLQVLNELVWSQDEPFGSTSIYAQWCVFRLAAQHGIKVMLDGQGADESLAGYPAFFGPRLAGLVRALKLSDLEREIVSIQAVHGYSSSEIFKMTLAALAPQGACAIRNLFRGTAMRPSWLRLEKLKAQSVDPFGCQEPDWRRSIRALSHSQLTRVNLGMLLHWEDRNSMIHSIEARVPFLDYRFVEFALGVPDEFKIKNGVTKRVLREAMRGTVPDMVADRTDKVGFETAEGNWIRQSPDAFRFLLDRAVKVSDGVLTGAARTVINDFLGGTQRLPYLLIRLISFGLWLERFAVRV